MTPAHLSADEQNGIKIWISTSKFVLTVTKEILYKYNRLYCQYSHSSFNGRFMSKWDYLNKLVTKRELIPCRYFKPTVFGIAFQFISKYIVNIVPYWTVAVINKFRKSVLDKLYYFGLHTVQSYLFFIWSILKKDLSITINVCVQYRLIGLFEILKLVVSSGR